jgi:hypothetical protein
VSARQLGLDLRPPDPPRRRRAGALRSFHVRSHMTVGEATGAETRAAGQEEEITDWFCRQPAGARFTPSEVWRAFQRWPLTSVRRALTNLAHPDVRILVHHEADRRLGLYGKKESTWSLP